jgi:hypothetical protein
MANEMSFNIIPYRTRRTPGFFCGVRVIKSLVFWVVFVHHCLSFFPFSCGHCIVYPSSIYGFWWLHDICKLVLPFLLPVLSFLLGFRVQKKPGVLRTTKARKDHSRFEIQYPKYLDIEFRISNFRYWNSRFEIQYSSATDRCS